jgi:hypothetical protein
MSYITRWKWKRTLLDATQLRDAGTRAFFIFAARPRTVFSRIELEKMASEVRESIRRFDKAWAGLATIPEVSIRYRYWMVLLRYY